MLAQLLTDTIKLEIAAAQAELNLRKEELAELQNGTRPAEIEQAKARMLSAEARVKYAQARRTRVFRMCRAFRISRLSLFAAPSWLRAASSRAAHPMCLLRPAIFEDARPFAAAPA